MNEKWEIVLFIDLDDTVLKGPFESAVFPIVFKDLANKSGIPLSAIRRLVIDENFKRQKLVNYTSIQAMDWDDIIHAVAKSLDISISKNIVTESFNNHLNEKFISIIDNAATIIQKIKKSNLAIVAATKGLKKYQIPLLKKLNLFELFDDILTPDVNKCLKNDINFYGEWPTRTKLQIIFGDHYQDDIFYPNKFGFITILKLKNDNFNDLKLLDPFIRSRKFKPPHSSTIRPDAILFNIDELLDITKRIEVNY